MRIKPLFLAFAALFLCGCYNHTQTVIDFDYARLSPLMVEFTNYSTGCSDFRWDFGDGTFAFGQDALHTYETTGIYQVTLSATADGEKVYLQQAVNVSVPNVYFAGYTIYKIPYESRYYKLVFKDDNLLPSDWDFETVYTPMLENADLPYYHLWQTPQKLDRPETHAYYTVQLIRSTNTSSDNNDISCFKQQITRKQLLLYQPEYILRTESGSAAVGIHMAYTYN